MSVELPDVAEILGQVLRRVPEEQTPLLLAIAERMSAARYRGWAAEMTEPVRRSELLACADREEEIARRVEALYLEAASIQGDIVARNPDLEEINRSVFAGRPLQQQFTIQAQGESLGAATWRSFAQREPTASARDTFLACAALEEDNAALLDSLIRGE